MRKCNGIANAKQETQAVRDRSNRLDVLVKAPAFDKFHGVENAAVAKRPQVVNGDDAGMLESSQDASFADKPTRQITVASRNIENFQGHAPLEVLVLRGVHNAHAATGDAFQKSITCAREIRRSEEHTSELQSPFLISY